MQKIPFKWFVSYSNAVSNIIVELSIYILSAKHF